MLIFSLGVREGVAFGQMSYQLSPSRKSHSSKGRTRALKFYSPQKDFGVITLVKLSEHPTTPTHQKRAKKNLRDLTVGFGALLKEQILGGGRKFSKKSSQILAKLWTRTNI